MLVERLPHTVRNTVKAHLTVIAAFNAGILQARQTEEVVGQAGREEYNYRVRHEAAAVKSAAELGRFAQNAAAHCLDAQKIYDEWQLSPLPLPWSDAALAWGENGRGARM